MVAKATVIDLDRVRSLPKKKVSKHRSRDEEEDDEDDVPVVRKPKKSAKALQKRNEKLHSLFKEDAPSIIELLDNDGAGTGPIASFQRAALQTLIDMIPVAEAEYRNRPGMANAQALQTFMNGARELVADMEATEDRGAIADALLLNVTNPAFVQIVQNIILTMSLLKDDIRPFCRSEEDYLRASKHINKAARSIGHYINETHKSMTERIHKQLTES